MPLMDDRNNHLAMVIHQGALAAPAVNTMSVDTKNYDGGYTFMVAIGDNGSGALATIEVRDSDNNVNFDAVSSDQIVGDADALVGIGTEYTTDSTALTFGIINTRRYVRLRLSNDSGVGADTIANIFGNALPEIKPSTVAEGVPILV